MHRRQLRHPRRPHRLSRRRRAKIFERHNDPSAHVALDVADHRRARPPTAPRNRRETHEAVAALLGKSLRCTGPLQAAARTRPAPGEEVFAPDRGRDGEARRHRPAGQVVARGASRARTPRCRGTLGAQTRGLALPHRHNYIVCVWRHCSSEPFRTPPPTQTHSPIDALDQRGRGAAPRRVSTSQGG
jgi:hypothetical protein